MNIYFPKLLHFISSLFLTHQLNHFMATVPLQLHQLIIWSQSSLNPIDCPFIIYQEGKKLIDSNVCLLVFIHQTLSTFNSLHLQILNCQSHSQSTFNNGLE
jgi:hypothetical protein